METQNVNTTVQHNANEISQKYLDDLIAAAKRIRDDVGTDDFPLVFSAYVTARYSVAFLITQ